MRRVRNVPYAQTPAKVLERLRALRDHDAPTRGGRVLAYVYDSGVDELGQLERDTTREVLHLNGLDPLTFPSIAHMERDVVGFVRDLLGGQATGAPDDVVGTFTSGGTESCMLAVKTARDVHDRFEIVAPTSAHPAFAKAAEYFGMTLVQVPCDPLTGRVDADALLARVSDATALVVASAPSYPHAALDPIEQIAAGCVARGVDLHVDACIGGLALPFWDDVAPWDFRVEGVTSISADIHKYGYAPKGASVLLHRGRDRQRAQFFAWTEWPGYPVVTSTMLGSRSAVGLATGWATITALGADGLRALMDECRRVTVAVRGRIEQIDGLRVVGTPVGPLLALASDDDVAPDRRVDPHRLADALRPLGWVVQSQPGLEQSDGTHLPATAHLTITPVLDANVDELLEALSAAADDVRGTARADVSAVLAQAQALAQHAEQGLDAATASAVLQQFGVEPGGLPSETAGLMALIEHLPRHVVDRLLIEILAGALESPIDDSVGSADDGIPITD